MNQSQAGVNGGGGGGGGGAGIKNMLLMVMHLKRLGKDLAAKVR